MIEIFELFKGLTWTQFFWFWVFVCIFGSVITGFYNFVIDLFHRRSIALENISKNKLRIAEIKAGIIDKDDD